MYKSHITSQLVKPWFKCTKPVLVSVKKKKKRLKELTKKAYVNCGVSPRGYLKIEIISI